MQNVIDKLELMFAGMGAFLGWFFGGFDGFFYALVVFVTCDYFTGVLAAAVRHELSSEVGFKGIAKKGREGTVAFLNGLTGEHCKAFILSITVYSPLKYSVHWFDDTRTKVEMDSNIEDFRNTASYYDGQVMRDNAYRKRFIK